MIPVSLGLSAANKSSIKIDGAILVRITAVVDGKQHSCATMVYISPSCQGFFMSMETMLDLDLFQTFTKPQAADCNMVGGELKGSLPIHIRGAIWEPHGSHMGADLGLDWVAYMHLRILQNTRAFVRLGPAR